MKEWEKELYMYRLSPAPPKVNDLQEYIDLYLSEKDEKYFEWFLHYYEPILNTTAMGIVQRYASVNFLWILQVSRMAELKTPTGGFNSAIFPLTANKLHSYRDSLYVPSSPASA